MREVLYYTIHCPLIIQKDLDLWKLDFSFLILLYRETCNICNTCSLCSLIHFFWRIPTREEKLFVHTFHGIISIFLETPTLFFSFSSDTIFTDTVSVMGIVQGEDLNNWTWM